MWPPSRLSTAGAAPGQLDHFVRGKLANMYADIGNVYASSGMLAEAVVEYRRALSDTESHKAYATQLAKQVESQQGELAEIQRQLDEVEDTSRAIVPLEQKMLGTLKEFVRLDIPFLLEERSARVATLEEMMNRADVSISEKYRRILEAYRTLVAQGAELVVYPELVVSGYPPRDLLFKRDGAPVNMWQKITWHPPGAVRRVRLRRILGERK